jgi:hypothetical protein
MGLPLASWIMCSFGRMSATTPLPPKRLLSLSPTFIFSRVCMTTVVWRAMSETSLALPAVTCSQITDALRNGFTRLLCRLPSRRSSGVTVEGSSARMSGSPGSKLEPGLATPLSSSLPSCAAVYFVGK